MKHDHFANHWRSPLAVLLTLAGLGILPGFIPLPSQADQVVDPADPAANYQYEDDSQEDYQNMNKDNYQNTDDYYYRNENKLKSENDNQEDYQNDNSEDYENINQMNYKDSN